jgi:hypothetical protein
MTAQFITDTSTLAVFDPEALIHRIDDDGDWWTYPDEAVLTEINNGNVGIIDLGTDGRYDLRLHEEFDPQVTIQLRTPSSRIFIGAGEEISGGGLQPEAIRGVFLELKSAAVLVSLRRIGCQIDCRVEPNLGSPSNSFSSLPILDGHNRTSEQGVPPNGL